MSGFAKILLLSAGTGLIIPIALVVTVILTMNNRLQSKQPPQAAAQQIQDYARSFHMIIREPNQNLHIWARNLDGMPDFRQAVEVNGQITSQQLYVYAEKSLYSSQQSPGQPAAWSRTGNLEPKDIGISNITAGPAVWALKYGPGDNQVKLQQGSLNISVKSVNQAIDSAVFQPSEIDLNQ